MLYYLRVCLQREIWEETEAPTARQPPSIPSRKRKLICVQTEMTEAAVTLIAFSLSDPAHPTTCTLTITSSSAPIPQCCCECPARKSAIGCINRKVTLKHEIVNQKHQLLTSKESKAQSNFGVDFVCDDDVKCTFYNGLTFTWL